MDIPSKSTLDKSIKSLLFSKTLPPSISSRNLWNQLLFERLSLAFYCVPCHNVWVRVICKAT